MSSPPAFLGEFEQMVLLAIVRLGEDAYGLRIMEELRQRIGRKVSRGAMYVTLDRLEAKDLLTSFVAEPRPERGGRGRKYVTVTPAGLEALRHARWALDELWKDLDLEIGGLVARKSGG